jgi:N-methylhydantoinase A
MTYRVGVDIGGSFTDFAVLDERDNSIRSLKVLSRPESPGSEVLTGLQQLKERYGIEPHQVSYFTHGTTVGVNSVIQRKGTKLGLITTANFEDVLELARLKIPQIHNMLCGRPVPLITRDLVFGVRERTDRDGKILTPVDRESVLSALAAAREAGCSGIVVALLHSYRNRTNEATVRSIIAEVAPEMFVSCSSEIWPIIREYERTITAVINAYVQPQVATYLDAFEKALSTLGVPCPPRITKSNGGVMGVAQARAECVQMILSGTASGVIGASYIGKSCGYDKLMSFDVGGTSADVAVIIDGKPEYGVGELIGEFQIYIPSVSVSSIGQGGGSIAWLDALGVLKVGPESAGSSPGPACFGKGGLRPTLTDAFVCCGLVGHRDLGYNAVHVDIALARAAVSTIATPLGLTIEQAAEQIIQVAVSGMYADTSALLSRFGIDSRDFYFLAFGGAGPMTACFLARELNMKGVIVPTTPGVLSALGGLIADLKNDFIQTVYEEVSPSMTHALQAAVADLEGRAKTWLQSEHGADLPYTLKFSADMRYRGQSFEIETPLEERWLVEGNMNAIRAAFDQEHERMFGYKDLATPVMVINLRLVISSPTPKPELPLLDSAEGRPMASGSVDAYVDGQTRQVPFYLRATLKAGQSLQGPAIIGQDDCTTCIPTGMGATVDRFGNLVITPATH